LLSLVLFANHAFCAYFSELAVGGRLTRKILFNGIFWFQIISTNYCST
jgi:hypothetical protein